MYKVSNMTLREPFKHARANVVVGLGGLDPVIPSYLLQALETRP